MEQRGLAEVEADFANEDPDLINSVLSSNEWFFGEVRKAANNLAIVGVVTRLQHWAVKYVRKLGIEPAKSQDSLIFCLNQLNESLEVGPVPIAFFEELVVVRDSVIHADGKAKWTHKGRVRTVAEDYSDGRQLVISEEQVKEAILKAIEQIKWYSVKLYPQKTSPSRQSS